MPSTKLLKERIESIQDTMKITNAMYLISSSKLRKARKNYQAVSPYFKRMQMTMTRVLPHLPEEPVHPFFHTRNPESPAPRLSGADGGQRHGRCVQPEPAQVSEIALRR